LKYLVGALRIAAVSLFFSTVTAGVAAAKDAIIVAVIDSGVDSHHSDLRGKLLPGFDLTLRGNPNIDRVGHGTAMASLIAGHSLGACPACKILPLKITDDMSVSLDKVTAAIDIAVGEGVSFIYIGAGAMTTTEGLTRAVENAHAAGISIIAPVGAQNLDQALYPAAYPTVVAVAAVGQHGRLFNSTNNSGKEFQYAAGQNVKVANVKGGFMLVNGSSPAAAKVAGRDAQAFAQSSYRSGVAQSQTVTSYKVAFSGKSPDDVPTARLQYGDTDDTDIIVDAPWRTIRDYLPFMVFAPELEQTTVIKRNIQRVELYNFDRNAQSEADLIFRDVKAGADKTNCAGTNINIIDADGRARATMGADEVIGNFWHYIVKVPIQCIGVGNQLGADGEHFLFARVYWLTTTTDTNGNSTSSSHNVDRVLRVLIGSDGFPRFSPEDHYYDAHVHTIAEQTGWSGLTNVNAARKAFGGPLAMLTESAYALGLIETQLVNGNWTAFRDQLVTTDHNVFFSGNPYDAGTSPGYGPTSATNGKQGEFNWYRENLGELSGEEMHIWGTGRNLYNSDMTKAQGSHFLVYGGPHFEGPWHGGNFTVDTDDEILGADVTTLTDFVGVENPNRMASVLERLRKTDAFGYAAHPFDTASGWSKDYYQQTIGLPPNFNDGGPNSRILQNNGRDFIFKGAQVWNEKHEFKSTAQMNGKKLLVKDLEHLDPFSPRVSTQRFQANPNWDESLNGSMLEYISYLKRGLKYNFAQQPEFRFIRKLYMSAGTDAHGDFNYLTGLRSTSEAELSDMWGGSADNATISSNAFGRVRTYTLTAEKLGDTPQAPKTGVRPFKSMIRIGKALVAVDDSRSGGSSKTRSTALRASVAAYREGNTILTDGPICKFSVDSECRFDSTAGDTKWHDSRCVWENADGQIGGEGDFDGGGSVLISRGSDVMLNTRWDGRNDYRPVNEGQPDNIQFTLNRHSSGRGDVILVDGGPRGIANYVSLAEDMVKSITERRDYSPAALMLRGDMGSAENRASCITNPVWTIPAKFYYPSPPSTCSIKPGDLRVSISFGVSMDSTLSDRCKGGDCLAPVNGRQGNYQGPTIKIYPLNSSGESTGNGTALKLRWFANNLSGPGFKKIQDANLVGDNDVEIACPSGNWDTATHSKKRNQKSYAVIVSGLRDMHGNELNAIANTFTVEKTRLPQGPLVPPPGTGTVFEPDKAGATPAQACSAKGAQICSDYFATCTVTTALNGKQLDLCRWNTSNTKAKCDRTVGIWTTAGSKYAKIHPDAVKRGQAGACLTEAKNLEQRID
jgi:subtilase family protein